jgi:hypothetical protein
MSQTNGEVADFRDIARHHEARERAQSIIWPGPAMKPSSDIDLFTTTLPFPVLVSIICSSEQPRNVPILGPGVSWTAILASPGPGGVPSQLRAPSERAGPRGYALTPSNQEREGCWGRLTRCEP